MSRSTSRLNCPGVESSKALSGIVQFFGTLMTNIDTRVERSALIACGDHVVEVGRTRGRALATGDMFDVTEVHIWTVQAQGGPDGGLRPPP